MSGHTPGPWRLDGEDFNRYESLTGIYVAHDDGGRICQCFANCRVVTDEELRANARLIAAAPELLEGLLQVAADRKASRLGQIRVATEEAIARAIAKATA